MRGSSKVVKSAAVINKCHNTFECYDYILNITEDHECKEVKKSYIVYFFYRKVFLVLLSFL